MNEQRRGVSIHSYISGFVLSVALTLVVYMSVVRHAFSHQGLVLTIAGLAVAQCIVQLFFFLHLGSEQKARWKVFVFVAMLVVVGILVVGSLWIMDNLNYRMTPSQVNTYLHDQDGL